ncbi:MAG: UDP-glucose/GDP-mannose dehydrogenase family protein [Bdellovibrionales bacterium]
MDIAVIGTGYVGLVAATCFADAGHNLICADANREKLTLLKAGKVPFYEPGLEELFAQSKKRMTFVPGVADAVTKANVIFVAVGTPELPDGSADMQPTFRVLEEICASVTEPSLVVLKSTVPIGTARRASQYCLQYAKHPIEIVSNPEFLRQGAALEDFLKPDRVVIGCQSEKAKVTMTELYEPFLRHGGRMQSMDNTSAEMVKYAANSFLALKISFINELALLADKLGADIDRVREGFTSDHRINPAFFNPGIGYGGSCFPKDVRALVYTGKQVGLDLKLLQAADDVNERQKSILTDRLYKRFGSLQGLKIAIWGLAFKPRTDDVRRAPAIKIMEDLVRHGATVSAYDPIAMENTKQASLAKFEAAGSALEAAHGADALLIITEWSEFKGVDLEQLKSELRQPVIFDGRNLFDPAKMSEQGFEYYGIGRQVRGTSLTTQNEKLNPLASSSWMQSPL